MSCNGEVKWRNTWEGKDRGTEDRSHDWEWNCNYKRDAASIEKVFVATTDDFVGGARRSIVEDSESLERSQNKIIKLREAQNMLKEGLITQEEFNKLKKKLLGI